MDKRKNYYMVLDTETCNGFMENGKLNLEFSLVYDIGFQIIDKKGNVYIKRSYAVKEIFEGEQNLMLSAYYADKIPFYYEEIEKGLRQVETFWNIRKEINFLLETYNVKAVSAHNARFDLNALNITARWLSGSACRYFFKYGTTIYDTLKMARQTYGKEKGYENFCHRNGYLTKHKTPQIRFTAEILYRYISGNNDFIEVHEGLDDVIIESELLVAMLRKHKPFEKELFKKVV